MASPLYPTASSTSKAGLRSPTHSATCSAPVAPKINSPEINSIGPPPEIHADRIIGLMLQQMVREHSLLWAAIRAIPKDPHIRDGNPRAQAKLEAKIKNLGALATSLQPGKRGRYELDVYSLAGWDPQRDTLIEPGDPIPKKPWICTLFNVIRGEGHGRVRSLGFSPVLFLTHHCLSRSAQRWGVRTVGDLSAAIKEIIAVAFEYLRKRGQGDEATGSDASTSAVIEKIDTVAFGYLLKRLLADEATSSDGLLTRRWLDTPPEGVRLPMPGGDGPDGEKAIVLAKYETRQALVVATVLD